MKLRRKTAKKQTTYEDLTPGDLFELDEDAGKVRERLVHGYMVHDGHGSYRSVPDYNDQPVTILSSDDVEIVE